MFLNRVLLVAAVAFLAPAPGLAQMVDPQFGRDPGPEVPAETRPAQTAEVFAVQDAKNAEHLRYFVGRDARADADAAIVARDLRLLGVYGYSEGFPGAPAMVAFVPTRCGKRIIEGTSDAVSDVTRPLNQAAYDYARIYNRRIIDKTGCLQGADLSPPRRN